MRKFVALAAFLLTAKASVMSTAAKTSDNPPYPPSPIFAGITFDKSTWVKAAPGSDQFGTTWASDGNLFVSWGDGGGFGGTNARGRASLGIARIEGYPPHWRAVNVWGGVNPLSKQPPTLGKTSSGVIAVHGTIYLYVAKQNVWTSNHVWASSDLGKTWRDLGPMFNEPGAAFADPGIIQFGRGYAGARDHFVYGYSEKPWRNALALFRVPTNQIAKRSAYEFFAGIDSSGKPKWTKDVRKQKPVFTDPNGTEWGVTCVYHPVFKRYLLSVRHNGDSGEWGLFDAPEPWGPWTTVAYGKDFPEWTYTPDPKGASPNRPAWMHTFPAKWISQDGQTLWHICDRGDQFNLMKATLILRKPGTPSKQATQAMKVDAPSPPPVENEKLKKEAETIVRVSRETLAPVYAPLAEQIVAALNLHDKRGIGIDVGSGPGTLIVELCKRTAMHWINADINPYFFAGFYRLAEKHGVAHRVSAIYADVQDLPFRDDYADVIVSRGSYPFWPDLQKGLSEIYRVLKPGGAAYIGRGFSGNLPLATARAIRKKQGKKMHYDLQKEAEKFRKIMKALKIKRYRIVMPSVERGYDVNYGVWIVFWKDVPANKP